jgi:hypothetical protein
LDIEAAAWRLRKPKSSIDALTHYSRPDSINIYAAPAHQDKQSILHLHLAASAHVRTSAAGAIQSTRPALFPPEHAGPTLAQPLLSDLQQQPHLLNSVQRDSADSIKLVIEYQKAHAAAYESLRRLFDASYGS